MAKDHAETKPLSEDSREGHAPNH